MSNEVTQEQINEWKSVYKKVYKTDTGIYFRTLQRSEYLVLLNKSQQGIDNFDYELEITKTCLLGGITPEELVSNSGISTVLHEQIMLKSGFTIVEVEEV